MYKSDKSYDSYPVTYKLTNEQRQQLKLEMNKFAQDGHYGAAYTYLYNNVPKSDYGQNSPLYTKEEAAIKTWFSFVVS